MSKARSHWIARLARSVTVDNPENGRREVIDPENGEVLEFVTIDAICQMRKHSIRLGPWGTYPPTIQEAIKTQHYKAEKPQ